MSLEAFAYSTKGIAHELGRPHEQIIDMIVGHRLPGEHLCQQPPSVAPFAVNATPVPCGGLVWASIPFTHVKHWQRSNMWQESKACCVLQ